jgi:MFS family permease
MSFPWAGVLRRGDVRALWFGETVSELGSSVSSLAIPLVAVVTLHAGAFATGTLLAAAWLPWVVIGLPAGAWVDRLPARRVMIVADVVSVLAFASVPVAAWLGVLTIEQLLVCALLGGCAAVFFQTSYQVFLPSLLDGDELAAANALMHGSQSAAQVGGPGWWRAPSGPSPACCSTRSASSCPRRACCRCATASVRNPRVSPRRCGARSPRGLDSSPGTGTCGS